jgi:hypothetical protein
MGARESPNSFRLGHVYLALVVEDSISIDEVLLYLNRTHLFSVRRFRLRSALRAVSVANVRVFEPHTLSSGFPIGAPGPSCCVVTRALLPLDARTAVDVAALPKRGTEIVHWMNSEARVAARARLK